MVCAGTVLKAPMATAGSAQPQPRQQKQPTAAAARGLPLFSACPCCHSPPCCRVMQHVTTVCSAAGADDVLDPNSAAATALIPTSPKSVEACFRLGIGENKLACVSCTCTCAVQPPPEMPHSLSTAVPGCMHDKHHQTA